MVHIVEETASFKNNATQRHAHTNPSRVVTEGSKKSGFRTLRKPDFIDYLLTDYFTSTLP